MIRRKPEDDEDSPDRWLVSYADFITLLFAFFVVMYSVSSVNQKKYRQLSSSINTAFISKEKAVQKDVPQKIKEQTSTPSSASKPATPAQVQKPAPHIDIDVEALQRERESMTQMGINLSNNLSPLISDGKIRVAQNNRGIRIDINDSVLFAPGSAELANTANDVLGEIAKLLMANSHAIQVEGHTDNTPIHTSTFYSNWELSAVRASSVVRIFNSFGVGDFRLSALGFGSTQPIGENDTPEGRAKNRRVSVMILYDRLSSNNDAGTVINPTGL